MKILYFGEICDNDLFFKKQKNQEPFFIAQYMYEKALCDNLIEDKDIDITIASIYKTSYFPDDKLIFNRHIENDKENFNYISFINLPILRELTYFLSSIFIICKWIFLNRNIKEKCIYSSCHFGPVSFSIISIGKIFKIKKIVTFTDLPLFTYSEEKINKMKYYKKILIKPYLFFINVLQQQYDGYILFSESMNGKVNCKNKKYCVIEGMFNDNGLKKNSVEKKSNTIVHAGTLNKEVGIKKILDVFDTLKNKDIQLVLIGQGDMVEEIKKRARNNKNILYMGFIKKEELFKYLEESTLLINLRDPKDIYTKYSFPSKMFEYMASGTPVLTTVLEGIPNEYYEFVYSVDSYNTDIISKKIIEIINEDEDKRLEIGFKAKKFIINNKNATYQTNKIKNLINSI